MEPRCKNLKVPRRLCQCKDIVLRQPKSGDEKERLQSISADGQLKYTGDIADLTAAFLRQSASFQLPPVLERTPVAYVNEK
jgi:hypothetical protein